MTISEAIKARDRKHPYIRRKSWEYPINKIDSPLRILPTDSPDGCIVLSPLSEARCNGWMPTAADLGADDWEVV